ncbi:lytic polysaccharide monooxygenase [Pendulispora rubella]|uniref:Lytic polysaccharide monooxygenase n=1 Tax=Pendulispora rubella TaxID=2741070 RepID=A0ABZ2LC61_9BACT
MIAGRVFAVLVGVGASVAAPAAHAHFHLNAPAASLAQDAQGNPQKVGPCGSNSGTSTGQVTAYRPGQAVDISINETVFHPGHYRVALAVSDPSELPKDPKVTPGPTPCGTAEIEKSPKLPVLGDGLLVHTSAFTGPQTMRVVLPSNVTCTKCTLQVLEFMSEHNPNCFYYHCANISIQGDPVDAGTVLDAGGPSSGDAGTGGNGGNGGDEEGNGGNSSSGGCSMPPGGSTATGGLAGLFALTLFGVVRRRFRRSRGMIR